MVRFSGDNLVCVRGERIVFAGLGFALVAGGLLVLQGPNGSGKSSLLRLMAGLARPAQGVIAWNGEDTADDPESHHRRLHYVGHADAVKPALTVEENLTFWARLASPAADATAAVAGALDRFGIADLAAIPGRFLSAGQRRRLALARIVATWAPLWLLDEPATALDAGAVKAFEQALVRHREKGGLAVVSAHAGSGGEGAQILDLAPFTRAAAGAP